MTKSKTLWIRGLAMAQKYLDIVKDGRDYLDFGLTSTLLHLFADAWYSGYKAGRRSKKSGT